MQTPASAMFEESILWVCGMQSSRAVDSLLSSLPSELSFNKLRDAARRHSKQERCSPASLHAVSCKATCKHTFGCSTLQLEDQDWSVPLGRKELKVAVHSALRATDRELGISAEGLTKHRTNRCFTKPHVFTARLDLLNVLTRVFHETDGSEEDKRVSVIKVFQEMWLAKVYPEGCMLRQKGTEDFPERSLITCRAGPYTIGCVKIQRSDDASYVFEDNPYHYCIPKTLEDFEVALVKALVNEKTGRLEWIKDGSWMSLCDYIADFSIMDISAGLLSSVCSKMKLKTSGLDHLHRAEFYLRHMGRSEEWIQECLAHIKARQKKRKEKKDQEKQDEENGNMEEKEKVCWVWEVPIMWEFL